LVIAVSGLRLSLTIGLQVQVNKNRRVCVSDSRPLTSMSFVVNWIALCQIIRTEQSSAGMPPNNPLQRSENDKVLGRGRGRAMVGQVCAARVLERTRAAAERGRYATCPTDTGFV